MAYEKLFTPGRIGPLTIRNRAVMSPMGTDFADTNGNASPRLIAYYAERAKGGIGLIINEYTGVDDVDSIPTQHNLRMAQDYNVKAAEELTETVHMYGAKIFAQLHHGGVHHLGDGIVIVTALHHDDFLYPRFHFFRAPRFTSSSFSSPFPSMPRSLLRRRSRVWLIRTASAHH